MMWILCSESQEVGIIAHLALGTKPSDI